MSNNQDKQQEKLDRALYDAVMDRNVIAIEEALKKGAGINSHRKSTFFSTPHYAYEKMISIAVQKTRTYTGSVPEKDKRVMLTLLKAGADINTKTERGDMPLLSYALKHKQLPLAEFLFEQGADPRLKCDEGHDAFYYADGAGYYDFLDRMQGKTAKKQLKKSQEQNTDEELEGDKVCLFDTLGDMNIEYWYNFEIEERITLIRNPKDKKIQHMTISPFTEVSKSALTKAFNIYKERGGTKELNDMPPMLKDKPSYQQPERS